MPNDTPDGLAARVANLEKQVDEIFSRLNNPESSPTVLATKLNSVLTTLGEVKQAVNDLKARPSRLWDTLIASGMGAVIATVIGLLGAYIK